MAATPCPRNPGCRCPACFGLAEYMHQLTGRDYGLPATFTPQPARIIERPTGDPYLEAPVVPIRRPQARQPWEPRPARRAA